MEWEPRWAYTGKQKEIEMADFIANVYCDRGGNKDVFKTLYYVHGRWAGYVLPLLMKTFAERAISYFLQTHQAEIELTRQHIDAVLSGQEGTPDMKVAYESMGG